MLLAAMSDASGGGMGVVATAGGKVKKPRKRYDILKTASCSVCGNHLFLSISILLQTRSDILMSGILWGFPTSDMRFLSCRWQSLRVF